MRDREGVALFQSTPSARRETHCNKYKGSISGGISIHSLREEGDHPWGAKHCTPWGISIHSLREEGDREIKLPGNKLIISIHSLREEGDILLLIIQKKFIIFQSTPSARRETYIKINFKRSKNNFNPLPPRGGRRMRFCWLLFSTIDFNPLPPRGGRRDRSQFFVWSNSISIHSLREEGDFLAAAAETAEELFQSTPSARRETYWKIFSF